MKDKQRKAFEVRLEDTVKIPSIDLWGRKTEREIGTVIGIDAMVMGTVTIVYVEVQDGRKFAFTQEQLEVIRESSKSCGCEKVKDIQKALYQNKGIIEKLKRERIFSVDQDHDAGAFEASIAITEWCDEYYSMELGKKDCEALEKLFRELKEAL